MATTDEIMDAATKLGQMVAEHETAKKFESSVKRLQDDKGAQRAMADYQRFATELIRKEQQGRPIEVADKRKLEQLQTAVVTNPVLRGFQTAQMDLLDLLRKIDEQITGETAVEEAPLGGAGAAGGQGQSPGAGAGASPLVYP